VTRAFSEAAKLSTAIEDWPQHERQQLVHEEKLVLLELRKYLRSVLGYLMKKFYMFSNVSYEPADWSTVILQPLALDTIREKNDNRKYVCVHDFLKDIDLIVQNCREYNASVPSGPSRTRISKACGLQDEALTLMYQFDKQLAIKCEVIAKRRRCSNYHFPEAQRPGRLQTVLGDTPSREFFVKNQHNRASTSNASSAAAPGPETETETEAETELEVELMEDVKQTEEVEVYEESEVETIAITKDDVNLTDWIAWGIEWAATDSVPAFEVYAHVLDQTIEQWVTRVDRVGIFEALSQTLEQIA
jgi:hypothetical protein